VAPNSPAPDAAPPVGSAGAGTPFSNDVRATPTYMVNGVMIDPENDEKYLESYVAGLLKK
jgi:hypothetical protein